MAFLTVTLLAAPVGEAPAPPWVAHTQAAKEALEQEVPLAVAERELSIALRLAERHAAPPEDVAHILDLLGGEALLGAFHLRRATKVLMRSLRIKERHYGDTHPEVADTLEYLSDLRFHQRRPKEGLAFLFRALAVREATLGESHPKVAATLLLIGTAHRMEGRCDLAQTALERALRIFEQASGKNSEDVAGTLALLVEVYRATAQGEAAQLAEERMDRIWNLLLHGGTKEPE